MWKTSRSQKFWRCSGCRERPRATRATPWRPDFECRFFFFVNFIKKFYKRIFGLFLFKVSWERLLNSVMDLSFIKKLIIFHIFSWPISCSNYWKLHRHALEWFLSRGKKELKYKLERVYLNRSVSHICLQVEIQNIGKSLNQKTHIFQVNFVFIHIFWTIDSY